MPRDHPKWVTTESADFEDDVERNHLDFTDRFVEKESHPRV